MIGYVAEYIGERLPRQIFNKVRTLCLDQDQAVRRILISEVLEKIIKTIPLDKR